MQTDFADKGFIIGTLFLWVFLVISLGMLMYMFLCMFVFAFNVRIHVCMHYMLRFLWFYMGIRTHTYCAHALCAMIYSTSVEAKSKNVKLRMSCSCRI